MGLLPGSWYNLNLAAISDAGTTGMTPINSITRACLTARNSKRISLFSPCRSRIHFRHAHTNWRYVKQEKASKSNKGMQNNKNISLNSAYSITGYRC